MITKQILKGHRVWLIGGFTLLVFGMIAIFTIVKGASPSSEAPEAELILNAQTELPFQVLVPAYLPRGFDRTGVQINTGLAGPAGEPMIELVYSTRRGETLTLREWLPTEQAAGAGTLTSQPQVVTCRCMQQPSEQCQPGEMLLQVDRLQVNVKVSAATIFTVQELLFVLNTLGPAANRQVFSSIQDVPVSYTMPPAENVPLNADGIQEVTLVVTPQGYSPVHFAVKKGVPVRLIFRQLGQVGCGNELLFQWGEGKSATLLLASENDKQVLEFTPDQAGEFRFNCPHLIYRGVMTVLE